MSLDTTRKSISEVLDLLKKGEWQIPQFQREFIWSPEQVKKLINSFLKTYPIGLITIWAQPQNKPHTPGEPLRLRDKIDNRDFSDFKSFDEDPAVIKLILDGKQRLTSLAMVFGGFHSLNNRYQYSGEWFINIDALIEGNEKDYIIYKKQSEITNLLLNTKSVCIQRALIPTKKFISLGDYLADINDPDTYPENHYPNKEIREKRTNIIKSLLNNYQTFQVPIAEVPATIDLGAVCEIFDVLNTTGTKVSTFDLIHNLLFKSSQGDFHLRDKIKHFSELAYFGFFYDERRQEFFNQIVTGCYLSEKEPFKNSNQSESISSIKGGDLIETPLGFYQKINKNSEKLNDFALEFFSFMFNTEFNLREIPYPVQTILYFSLRWNLFVNNTDNEKNVLNLNRIYKAFFWRNTLSNRYDQGFLTQFTSDLKFLRKLIQDVSRDDTSTAINNGLNELFGNEYLIKNKEAITNMLKDSDSKGAISQLFVLFLNYNATKDIIDSKINLDRFSDDKKKKVQLHHIFPTDWCRNNKGKHSIIEELSYNHFANLVPLSADSNNKWKAFSPSTAIKNLRIDYHSSKDAFDKAFIDSDCFNFLKDDNVEKFWDRRADLISEKIYNLQFVQ